MLKIDKIFTTKEKALHLNLNKHVYGTIAEIGGGQEVAAHFFKAGAASGSIAKTMSAYDMTFSDAIYGKCDRYVSKEKLVRMLDREYNLLDQRLTLRARKSTFFAFANTVEVINYNKTNLGHGWIGLRFQKYSGSDPNDCIIHVTLKDQDTEWQQQVLGIIGVNLIHSCYVRNSAEEIIESLSDNLRKDRLEVDFFSISGPDFQYVDNRLMTLKLVRNNLTKVAMFGPDKQVVLPSDTIYKKNTVVLRGRFRPVTLVNEDMMIKGISKFKKELNVDSVVALSEITLNDLKLSGEFDEQDYLDRVDLLCSLGQTVMISNYQEHYKLTSYLSDFTKDHTLGIILGLRNLNHIFDESYYQNLSGGIVESFGRLFKENVKLLVYPALDNGGKKLMDLASFKPAAHLQNLFDYFLNNRKIIGITDVQTENLHIFSDNVLKMIENTEKGWEAMVPNRVAKAIKENHLFNHTYPVHMEKRD